MFSWLCWGCVWKNVPFAVGPLCGELLGLIWLSSAFGLPEPLSTLPWELICAALAVGFALGLLLRSCCSGQQELAVTLKLWG